MLLCSVMRKSDAHDDAHVENEAAAGIAGSDTEARVAQGEISGYTSHQIRQVSRVLQRVGHLPFHPLLYLGKTSRCNHFEVVGNVLDGVQVPVLTGQSICIAASPDV